MYNTRSVPYGLQVITMSRWRFILGKNCNILVSDVDNGGDYACVGTGNLCTFLQFCYKAKTALRK